MEVMVISLFVSLSVTQYDRLNCRRDLQFDMEDFHLNMSGNSEPQSYSPSVKSTLLEVLNFFSMVVINS